MRPSIRYALARPGTWREAISSTLESLGGEASLPAIYDAISPERQSSTHWRPKIRQTLQRNFRPLGGGRWSLPQHQQLRSEEHTSELQSLMRISYAVFCLKKKKTNTT